MSVSQIRRALLILLLLLTSCGAFCRASLSLCRIRAFELGKRIAHFTKWADVSRLLHFPKCSIRLPISWNRQFYRLGVTYALIIVCCVTCICRTQALTQKKALRIMTGQANTTPVEALSAESGICRYRTADHSPTESDQLWVCVKTYEKAARFPEDHPKRIALTDVCQHRLHRSSWQKHATELLTTLSSELQNREPVDPISDPFWRTKRRTGRFLQTARSVSQTAALKHFEERQMVEFGRVHHLHRWLSEWRHARSWSSGSHHHGPCWPSHCGKHTASERTNNHKFLLRRTERCRALGFGVDCSQQTSGHDSNLLW